MVIPKIKKMEETKYRAYSFKLSNKTIELLREFKKKSGKSWNLFFNEVIKKNMGILDFVPRKEFVPKKPKGDIELNCDKCGSKFMGFKWMTKKGLVICPRCWRYEKLDEENNKC